MESVRPGPYSQFTFLVDLGTGNGPHAGFQELSHVDKITGLNKATDVTMKRGVISSSALEDWLNQIRKDPKRARRNVSVTLHDAKHRTIRTWKLVNAVIVKYIGPSLNAKGGDVPMEELVLHCGRIEVKSGSAEAC